MKLRLLITGLLVMGFLLGCGKTQAIEEDEYMTSIRLGAEWFLNNQGDDFLYYEYYPYTDKHPEKHHSMREMGAMWSIAKAGHYLNDDRLIDLAEKGFEHFEETFECREELDFCYVNITPGKIKLGYSAFVILTLLEIDHPRKDHYLEKFANSILYQQRSDGYLKTFFFSPRDTGVDYYPGEALLALMSLYEADPQPRYLKAAEKAYFYYHDYFKENPNTAFVPWQTQAFYKLYQATEDEKYREFIFNMNDFMIDAHRRSDSCDSFDFSRGIVTGVYMEGVNKAYGLAKDLDNEKRAYCYRQLIQKGAYFLTELQIRPDNDFGIDPLPEPAIGGFLGNKDSRSNRVDRNQHAILALMGAYELGLLK